MKLTPTQEEQLNAALLNAFSLDELKALVLFKLGRNLDEIVSTYRNQTGQVFELIRWADREARIEELIAGARDKNPGNPMLRAFAEQLQSAAPPQQTPPPQRGAHRQHDIYSPYEIAMEELLNRLGSQHPRYSEALVYRTRLNENIKAARRYGTNNGAERAEIIDQLNDVALDALRVPFTELK